MRFIPIAIVFLSIAAVPPLYCSDAVKPAEARPSNGKGGKSGTFADEKIDVKDQAREYRLIVPVSVDPAKSVPLVFAFHGLGDSKDLMPIYSQLPALAEKHGFVLVIPNGRKRHWPLLPELAKDDLAFFDALYSLATTKYNIDLNRVYLTGMSNGAYFCHVVASQRSDKIAAIAPHSGGMGLVGFAEPKVAHKYAVLAVNGDADSIVKVDEGRKTRDTYKKWGYDIDYIELPGQGHVWAAMSGINEKIWAFFEAHPFK